MTDWQPIETAPKDGTFLAAIHHGQAGNVVVIATRRGKGVTDIREESCVGWSPGYPPAYWMPLPEAPPCEVDA